MLKILVPYDGSKPSDNAFNQAVRLAEATKNSSEIILLHVLPEIPVPATFERPVRSQKTGKAIPPSEYVQELYEIMKSNAQEMLNKKKAETAHITTKLSAGRTVDEILKCAKEEDVDLIVIGNVGLGGIRKFKMLGSVSRGVSERADRPVMIVH